MTPDPATAVSYWLAATPPPAPRPPLAGDVTTDVAIVGAGFTGLWTAIALTDRDPGLRATVLLHAPIDPAAYGSRKALAQVVGQVVAEGAATLRQNRPARPLVAPPGAPLGGKPLIAPVPV